MEKIKFRKSLSVLQSENALVHYVINEIKGSMEDIDLSTLKYDTQFLVDICKCVNKNARHLSYKGWNIQKKNVVMKIYFLLYSDTVDMTRIENLIDFAEENGLIYRKSIFRMILEFFARFF